MDDQKEKVLEELTKRQVNRLVASLASMRTHEESDVILVCENVEFPAHRLVLKASCPYFKGMFQSNMKETTCDRVEIQQVVPDAMKVVLDYLYLGTIPEITSADLLIKLTETAHLFQLSELFNYCCSILTFWLSGENYSRMFSLAVLYDQKEVLNSVMDYITVNVDSLLDDTNFLSLSFEDLKELLNVAKGKSQIMEELFMGIINWICYDLETREHYTGVLLDYINIKCVRREFMKFLLDTEKLAEISMELANKIKDLAVAVFYELSEHYYMGVGARIHDIVSENCVGTKLVFFSNHQVVLSFDASVKCFVKLITPCNSVQQLDICTMTWCPPKQLPFGGFSGSAMCQHRNCIYMVGGELESAYVMYNLDKNTVRYITCSHFNKQMGGLLLPLRDHIYFIDDKYNVSRITPGQDVCIHYYYTIHATWANPSVFATTNWIYISYFEIADFDKSLKIVRFADADGQINMQTLMPIPNIIPGMKVSFAVSSNSSVIYGFFRKNGCLVRVRNRNAQVEHWEMDEFPMGPSNDYEICSVYKSSQSGQNSVVLVAADENNKLGIPNYLLEPETCRWIKLPIPKWKCNIPVDNAHHKVYFVSTNCRYL